MHSGDSLTYHPSPLPEIHSGAFTDFVFRQDEVPSDMGKQAGKAMDLPAPIMQARFSDSVSMRASVFAGHDLKPVVAKPLLRPSGDFFWLSAVLLSVLILLSLIRSSGYRRLSQTLKAFAVARNTGPLSREGAIYREQTGIYLFLVFLAVTALFLFSLLENLVKTDLPLKGFALYSVLFAAVGVYYFFQLLMIRTAGIIFNTSRETGEYVLNHFLFSVVPALFLLIPVSLSLFTSETIAVTVLYACSLTYILVFLYRLIRGTMSGLGAIEISCVLFNFVSLQRRNFTPACHNKSNIQPVFLAKI
jgi:hypothetical protein